MSGQTVPGHRRSSVARRTRGSHSAPGIALLPDGQADFASASGRRSRSGGTIRSRLAAILALPLLVVLALVGIIATGELSNYRSATQTVGSVKLVLEVQDLVQELQTERGLTAGLLGGNIGFKDELIPVRTAVDERRATAARATAGGTGLNARVRHALGELDALAGVRVATDSGTSDRGATFAFFTARITALAEIDFGLDRTADRTLRRGLEALDAIGDAKESSAQERAFLNGVYSAGGFVGSEFAEYARMRADKESALARFNRFATPAQRQANAYVLDTGAARTAEYYERVAVESADRRTVLVNPQTWWSALTTVLDDMRRMQLYLGNEIQARAENLQNSATARLGVLVVGVLLFLVGGFVLLMFASRSITHPLAALVAEADGVATSRLPQAVRRVQSGASDAAPELLVPVRVPARASSEVRSVADALDRVQATAYALATEQAVLRRQTTDSMANLGRRNQNLLRRQLGFISELEREETDPSGLANLFELDHLATRMRRNAESLLVLAGVQSPRQWSAPMPVVDVIRAATGEVEEYRRVTMRRVEDSYLSGPVVTNVAHMLAELIENGLSFSPPDTTVEVEGRRLPGGYLIAVIDQGIGMLPDELAQANARLRSEIEFLGGSARYLGHSVVGHLARQMNVDVQLIPSPVTGLTARVLLPAELLADRPAIGDIAFVDADTGADRPDRADRRPSWPVREPVDVGQPDPVPAPMMDLPTQVIRTIDVGLPAPVVPAPVLSHMPPARMPFQPSPPPGPHRPAHEAMPVVGGRIVVPDDHPVAGAAPPAGPPVVPRQVTPGAPSAQSAQPGRPARPGSPTPPARPATATGEWTRNGLRRRPPRERSGSGTTTVPPAAAPTGDTVVDGSAAQVRSRLMSLRAGMRRGEDERDPAELRTDDHRTTDTENGNR